MTTVNRYRIYCDTDSKYEYAWGETEPTTCPVNTAHEIDSSKTTIIEKVVENEVIIREEETETGGHYQAQGHAADVPASTGWHDLVSISFPFPISILAAGCVCPSECNEDEISFCIGSDTTIGNLAADEAAGQTVLSVQQSVIDNITIGKYIKLDDGTNADDCGRVLDIDDDNNTITVETATTHAFAAATPTYVKVTTKMVPKLELVSGHQLCLGGSKIGGSYIPANTGMLLRYNNVDGASKRFGFILEYLY